MNSENMPEKASGILPPDFDGVFRFTNFTNEDFKAKWGGVEYTYPAQKTTPMIIPGATPEDVQYIRKKFAKELAIREFYKTPKFIGMNTIAPGGVPALYTDSDLADLIQKCLEPLPAGQATVKVQPKGDTSFLKTDKKGKPVSRVLDESESLMQEGSGVVA